MDLHGLRDEKAGGMTSPPRADPDAAAGCEGSAGATAEAAAPARIHGDDRPDWGSNTGAAGLAQAASSGYRKAWRASSTATWKCRRVG